MDTKIWKWTKIEKKKNLIGIQRTKIDQIRQKRNHETNILIEFHCEREHVRSSRAFATKLQKGPSRARASLIHSSNESKVFNEIFPCYVYHTYVNVQKKVFDVETVDSWDCFRAFQQVDRFSKNGFKQRSNFCFF